MNRQQSLPSVHSR